MLQKALGPIFCALCTGCCLAQAKEFCFGVNNEQYRCEMGYCCGETECCTYYYELWWFWLVWTLIIMLSCCCAYRHRRVKMRLQQEQRQREISLMAYQGASSSFVSPPPLSLRFWSDCKLPAYEEVAGHPPTPPPPYSETPTDGFPVPHLVLLPPSQSQSTVVLEPPMRVLVEELDLSGQGEGADSSARARGTVGGSQLAQASPRCLPEGVEGGNGVEPQPGSATALPGEEEGDGEGEEEGSRRRRHVTGDSGIEVCVCHLDVDEGCGSEGEEGEAGALCQGAGGDCCVDRRSGRPKERLEPDVCLQISEAGAAGSGTGSGGVA
ncbi:WW domain-binding protein 1 [Amia ocellicauda]|uniref:WW domain-binding protein 1 n=1 Tax=Amia ocellicauda TaxID=2972642 RepID=UPI003464C05C